MSIDPYFMLRMQACETRTRQEIEREQVRHVSLEEYQPGHPHYERLIGKMAENQQHHWPNQYEVNE